MNFDAGGAPLTRFTVDGNAIDAHGGEIEYFEGTYYLYGEHYACGFEWKNSTSPFCGFRVYSSPDLQRWTDRGPLFDPSSDYWQKRCSPGPLAADYGCFRPHVAYNTWTRKYVLWINGYGVPINFQVFESDSAHGPFEERGRPTLGYNNDPPWGINFGDENLFVDDDGTGYLAYTLWTEAGDIVVERLDSTYLSSSGVAKKVGVRGVEAPAMFKRGARYYMTLSDPNCGYCATGTSYVTADHPLGPWSAPRKISSNSCGGQPGHVSTLPAADGGKVYLYQSDLWISREANQAPAPQFWAPLAFDAAGEILPITCQATYDVPVPAGITTAMPGGDSHLRTQCDIGGNPGRGANGARWREFRFTPVQAGRAESVELTTFIRNHPSDSLVIEVVATPGRGERVLDRVTMSPTALGWSARGVKVPVDARLTRGAPHAIRLRTASKQGCYAFAFNDGAGSSQFESWTSTDGGQQWSIEKGRAPRVSVAVRPE